MQRHAAMQISIQYAGKKTVVFPKCFIGLFQDNVKNFSFFFLRCTLFVSMC